MVKAGIGWRYGVSVTRASYQHYASAEHKKVTLRAAMADTRCYAVMARWRLVIRYDIAVEVIATPQ